MSVLDFNNLTIDHVKLLNQINKETVHDFNKFLEEVYYQTDKSIDWTVNNIFSRNKNNSHIYDDLCLILLVIQLEQTSNISKVICQKYCQKKVLDNYFISIGKSISVVAKQTTIDRLKYYARPLYDFLRNIKTIIFLITISDKKRKSRYNFQKSIILLDMFFIPSMFKNNIYNDRYYTNILDFIPQSLKDRVYFLPNIQVYKNTKDIISVAENADENFIYKADFFKISDYFYALFLPFRIKNINFDFRFQDIDISHIISSDFFKNISNNNSFIALLNYRFFYRLRKKSIKIKLFINWFENQIIDKGMNKGFNQFYKGIQSIGYQGFVIPRDINTYTIPTELEVRTEQVPKRIAVIGAGFVNELKSFYGDLDVFVAPAFRFSYLHTNTKKQKRFKTGFRQILVGLPIGIRASNDIISIINLYNELPNNHNFFWNIKPHPSLKIKNLKKIKIDENLYTFSNDSFEKEILNADIFIGNSSSTCLEALTFGIPAIIIGSKRGLTENPIPNSVPNDLWEICYTARELKTSINRFFYSSLKNQEKSIGNNLLGEYFREVTKRGVRDLINL